MVDIYNIYSAIICIGIMITLTILLSAVLISESITRRERMAMTLMNSNKTTFTQSNQIEPVRFYYTNYRGEKAIRHVNVITVFYGLTEYHPHKQWFLKAFDLDKMEIRDFAIKDMEPIV